MKKNITLALLIFGMTTLFQGCYTILDLPEADSSDYVTTLYVQEIFYPAPVPVPPPVIVVPPSYSDQPVNVTNPPTKDRTNDIGSIRNDGNGRGNTSRDVNFSSNNNTSSNNTSTSSNNNTRSSSNVRNSGNGRR